MGTIKDVKEIKDELTKSTKRGFSYFMKNIGMVAMLFFIVFIVTNPSSITNPKEFFANFSVDSLWVILALFIALGGFYQLSRSLNEDTRKERDKENIEEYTDILDRKKREEEEHHNDLVKERFKVNPLISNELKRLLINLDGDRAAILEMHNGTNNLAGLPCIYGDMVYEETSPDVSFATDEFQNFNLAKLPFVSLHYHEGTWIGSVEEIEKEDAYLAAKLRVVQVNYGACVVLEGTRGPLGILTLFFKDEKKHPTKAKIIAELNHSSQILSTLLDKTKE